MQGMDVQLPSASADGSGSQLSLFWALAQKGFGTKVPLGERDSDPSAEADGN
jgi:hypothetical protein